MEYQFVNDDILSEKKKKKEFDKLIAVENVSDLADKSNEFGSFLTVSRKFGYSCIYLFHILYLSKGNW